MRVAKSVVRPEAFDLAKITIYANALDLALAQLRVPVGTIGSFAEETRSGHSYWYRRYFDANGIQKRVYIGAADSAVDRAPIETEQNIFDDWKQLAKMSKDLRALGFAYADTNSAATLAALHNAGIFAGGGQLVGSHAYGALLNGLGCRESANYLTEDIDVARGKTIKLAGEAMGRWKRILADTGLRFNAVPDINRKNPTTTYKVVGQRLRVDLLTPSKQAGDEILPIPELDTHAAALPYLEYLVAGESVMSVVLAKDKILPVRVPTPERFCVHKLLLSTLRSAGFATKAAKDRKQAGSLVCALVDADRSLELIAAIKDLPKAIRKKTGDAARRLVEQHLLIDYPEGAALLLATFA